MKVIIGPYKNWIGPYQIADTVFFWQKKYSDTCVWAKRAHEFGTWLSETSTGTESWLLRVCNWIQAKRHRNIYVRIDNHDTWGMDSTLALIVLPMLKQLQATKHGAPFVDDADVPDELKSSNAPAKEHEWDVDANHFLRWDYALNEMIFAFECKVDDSWQDKYRSGTHDLQSKPCAWDDTGKPTMFEMFAGPKDTYVCDYAGMALEQARIANGFRLFGKYYEGLWD